MKWQAPSERTQQWLVLPIAVPMAIVAAVMILPAVPVILLLNKLRPSQEWHRWFAWRPVPLGHWSDRIGKRSAWAWLETVERRARPYNWPTEYRLIGDNQQ